MEKRQGEKRTDVFFFISFFFDFLPEGSAASWARDKQQPAVGSSSPSYPREECQGKVPMAPGARLSRQRWAPRRPGCPPSGAGAEEPHALQTCHSPTRAILKQPSPSWPLASWAKGEMLVSAIPALSSPSCWVKPVPPGCPSRRTFSPPHLWDTPPTYSSHRYLVLEPRL